MCCLRKRPHSGIARSHQIRRKSRCLSARSDLGDLTKSSRSQYIKSATNRAALEIPVINFEAC